MLAQCDVWDKILWVSVPCHYETDFKQCFLLNCLVYKVLSNEEHGC